jgi:putative cardiolipin synthase
MAHLRRRPGGAGSRWPDRLERITGRATGTRPDYPRTVSTAFEGFASTRLGQFFGPAADEHPGLSGFSLLSHGREAFIVRLALADLAERSLDMQYYVWDGDTTGRIVVDHVMKAADRGVRVRLLVDDPFYKASDSIKACLDAHPNVEIRLFNPLTNRRWSILDFIFDFGRVNRRMHNKLMVADNAAAIVGGRNIGDIYYGVNTIANYRDLDVLAVGPVVRDLSGVFDRYWNSPSTVPIAAIVRSRCHPGSFA